MQEIQLPQANCPKCPRLCAFRQENQVEYPQFYNGAVPSFGGWGAALLIVGLAPGLKGANATGRPFTGDYAGDVLYPALIKAGFACQSSEYGVQSSDEKVFFSNLNTELRTLYSELCLQGTRITNAVRCVPPENKPLPDEIKNCNGFLRDEIAAMPHLKLILTLGLVSHNAVLKALGLKAAAFKFAHGAVHEVQLPVASGQWLEKHSKGGQQADPAMSVRSTSPRENQEIFTGQLKILNSYHTSRYNVNTGRLTFEMFDKIIAKALAMVSAD